MSQPKSDCLVIITGGTIDAEPYTATPEFITPLRHSLVPDAIKNAVPDKQCMFYYLCMKDSKNFSHKDQEQLEKLIKATQYKHVIVTYGTDKMPIGSRRLAKLLNGTDKTVVFTGAMTPLSHGEASDGHRNLQEALLGMENHPPGVHVVMNEKWFSPYGLRKNFKTKEFYVEEGYHTQQANRRMHKVTCGMSAGLE